MDAYHDPYRRCEQVCTHDLSAGVLVTDLLSGRGPYPETHPLLRFGAPAEVIRPERQPERVALAG
ncbi:MAG TPA: hypothetical protein ENK55_03330 [Actinobacteria bacterium]|nr:hypothetical protein [Actinomycetota bacterium]